MNKERLFTILLSISTILLSSGLSFIISRASISKSVKSESQRESFLKEVPVMNKVFEINEESDYVVLSYIRTKIFTEALVTRYVTSTGTELKRDTTYRDAYDNDTSYYYIPHFICSRESYNLVVSDLEYIESHLDELSFDSYRSVKRLLNFIKQHPIVLIEDKKQLLDSEWSRIGVSQSFHKLSSGITSSYLQRLKEFGLGKDLSDLQQQYYSH